MIEWIALGGLAAWAFRAQTTAQQLDDGDTIDNNMFTQYAPGVVAFAKAVSRAEGFGVPGATPTLAHNPGDLKRGDLGWGTMGAESLTKYPDDNAGWDALYRQWQLVADGQSHVYTRSMSILDAAKHYAPEDPINWSANVAAFLGVTPDTSLDSLL